MRIAIQSAAHITAVMFSTSVMAVEISPSAAELPSGDVWPFHATQQRSSQSQTEIETPDIPLPPARPLAGNVAPNEFKFDVPTEFKFNITLTIRPNDNPLVNHVARSHRPVGLADHADCRGQKSRVARCHG
jgi:hypothetical protein